MVKSHDVVANLDDYEMQVLISKDESAPICDCSCMYACGGVCFVSRLLLYPLPSLSSDLPPALLLIIVLL